MLRRPDTRTLGAMRRRFYIILGIVLILLLALGGWSARATHRAVTRRPRTRPLVRPGFAPRAPSVANI